MKILFVANTAWSIYNFRFGLISSLISKGYRICILAPQDDASMRLEKMGCEVYDLPMSAKGINPIEDLVLIVRMLKLYKTVNPDFIFHYTIKPNIYGSIAARILSLPSIAVTTGLGYTFIKDNWVSKIAKLLYKLSFVSPKEVWFLNEDDRKVFIEHNLVNAKHAILLHSEGVDTNFFHPKNKSLDDGKIRFLLIARMLWDKGVGEFSAAAELIKSKYPNAVFQLLGATGVENPSVISLEQIQSWEKVGHIEYLGTTADVRPIIADADCIVLPSFYREGVPRTLLEAASMGKPIITTDNVGCRDVVIDTETGFLCPVKDVDKLADCIEKVIQISADERLAMGRKGREFVIDCFDEKKIIEQYINTLSKYGIISS